MAIHYASLKAHRVPVVVQEYGSREVILYALAIGLGQDPVDRRQLRFVYEQDLMALPSMAVTLGYPGFWLRDPDTGVDWRRVLHTGQWLTLHAPVPVSASVTGTTQVLEVVDKGADKGALVYSKRELVDRRTGNPIATLMQSSLCRGDGGFGGPREWSGAPPSRSMPQCPADETVILGSRPESALVYRLCGDLNPLHADPEIAMAAGFPRPILHGLATYGVAGHAILKALCGYDARRLRRLDCRFVAPVFPGETIVTEMWRLTAGELAFRCSVQERKITVLDNGYAELRSQVCS
jgi:acyl dehydratase